MAVNCSLCLKDYDSQERVQRILPCSHKCCDECVARFFIKKSQKCQVCKKDWLSVDLLGRAESQNFFNGLKESDTKSSNQPTQHTPLPRRSVVETIRQSNQISSIVNEANRNSAASQALAEKTKVNCPYHGLPQMIWCPSCNRGGCKACLSLNHRACDWVLLEEITIPSQIKLRERTKMAFEKVTKRHRYFNQINTECKRKKDLMSDFTKNIFTLTEDIGKFEYFLDTSMEIQSLDVKSINESIQECVKANGVNNSSNINEKIDIIEQVIKNLEKLPQSKFFHLWNIIAIYQEMSSEIEKENFVEMFCYRLQQKTIRDKSLASEYNQESEETSENEEENADSLIIRELKREDSGHWILVNDDMADAATHLLSDTSIRPGKVTIVVNPDDSWSEIHLRSLLQVLSDKICEVHLQFMDSMNLDSETADLLQIKRLNQLKLKQMRCSLTRYFGRTSPKLLQVLPKTVEHLNLSIHDRDDLLNIPFLIKRNVKNNKFNVGIQFVLKQLGLAFKTNISISDLKVLDFESCSSLESLNLAFEQMHKDDLDMVVKIIHQISLPKKPVPEIGVSFMQCALTEDDFDLFLGHLRDFRLQTSHVCYRQSHLNLAALERIQKRYALFGIKFQTLDDAYMQV